MAAIQLSNPTGQPAAIETDEIIIVFFSPYLSPKNAQSNVVLGDSIRSFQNSVQQVADLARKSIKLVKLTLPKVGKGRARGDIWLRLDLITGVSATKSGKASVTMKRRKGPIIVAESKVEVEAAMRAA